MKQISHQHTPLLVAFVIYAICTIVTVAVGSQQEEPVVETQECVKMNELMYYPSLLVHAQEVVPPETPLEMTSEIEAPVAVELPEAVEEIVIEEEIPVEETHTYYDVPLRYGLQDCVVYYLDYMDIDLDATYIYALIYCESRFKATATGSSGDSGYMQVLQRYFDEIYEDLVEDYPQLAESEGWVCDPYDEKTNLAVGIYYLNQCAIEVTGKGVTTNNLSAALTGYNRGPNGAKSYFKENGTYVTSYSKNIIDVAHIIQENNGLTEELKNN